MEIILMRSFIMCVCVCSFLSRWPSVSKLSNEDAISNALCIS